MAETTMEPKAGLCLAYQGRSICVHWVGAGQVYFAQYNSERPSVKSFVGHFRVSLRVWRRESRLARVVKTTATRRRQR